MKSSKRFTPGDCEFDNLLREYETRTGTKKSEARKRASALAEKLLAESRAKLGNSIGKAMQKGTNI